MSDSRRFLNYPRPCEHPVVPYKQEAQSIPVFRGYPLVIGAALIRSIGLVQAHFWRNAGFHVIHEIKDLTRYGACYDPTVVPVVSPEHREKNGGTRNVPAARDKKNEGGLGYYYTSVDYRERYLSGELTPRAVTDALLSLVQRDIEPRTDHSTAFLESQVEAIRAAADASTKRYQEGVSLGPLDGVPVAIKDEAHIKGYKRMLGTNLDFKGGCDETSWCVKKWEEAGAIVIGKTTMHELGLDTNNNNPNYGTPRNPHNTQYYCGGSSGGSSYAVGAGLVPIALGVDGGGSIRIPSSFCGVWGLKTSHGRVSAAPTVGLSSSMGAYGPLAASIDDLALAYRVMAAPAPAAQDPISAQFPDPTTESALFSTKNGDATTKTIGIVRSWIDRAEPAVRAVFDATIDHYRSQPGYTVVDIDIPYLVQGQRAHALTIMAEIASGVTPAQIRRLTPPNQVLVSMGSMQVTAQDLIASQRLRALLMSHLAHLFRTHPGLVIVTPTTPIPGWKITGGNADLSHGLSDGASSIRNMEYVWLANFTGCPAISCPAGYSDDGVPIGVMGMSEWGSEEDLFVFARDGEALLKKDRHAPERWVDVFAQL
ncbi:hypothetical protein ASPZODRAFT_152643 [Penicilliopsis zonata CBS 506.65]|uniref:Amidase domain-containing protein n=1 Tax=Penicilliopsis zonata CBS 506.65 TaxID=1073090 RepID=A0A1L9SEM2_9EURO|nr:hypothetical protein ASPZODRAFT_152643 [Penicilliopsis zonata CBS 506.65]OJJ45598.1 hypothetical protein ASPZODRAFT_152643 [Penicilliopsis zonata CBS 506.65]